MQPLRLYVFLAFIAVLRCYELSQNLAKFYCVVNGNYNDKQQAGKDGASRSKMDLKLQPVVAPLLSELPLVYLQESISGVLERVFYGIVREGDDGIIYMKQHNFTGNFQINPDTFDPNQAKNLTPDDLQGKGCMVAFTRVQPFIFNADWENCRENKVQGVYVPSGPGLYKTLTCGIWLNASKSRAKGLGSGHRLPPEPPASAAYNVPDVLVINSSGSNKKRPAYVTTNTCNKWFITMPLGAHEESTLVQYSFNRQGPKYPLENAPSNYVCNCDNTSN